MADGTLIFDTELDSKGIQKGLKQTDSALEATGAKSSKAFGAMKTGAVAAGAAITKLGADSVKAYSNYEQLVGGVDTIFKDSSEKVQEYAANAYKTAGLSANEYMEQVTSFSASLLQSLDGDTEAAAEKADQAIIDMSDNANKMGTDITSIQNAYQGFAKGNFTMLDNLKLGYGGTKSEMERLLEDAEAISGVHYDIDNYADVVDAIHVIQDEMGIAGTTAKEAESTIQGSFGMMKSSWENLLVAMADPNADVSKVIGQFTESVGTFAKNVLPIVNNFAKTFGDVVVALVPDLLNTIGELLPTLILAVANLVVGVAKAIPSMVVTLLKALKDMVPQLIKTIVKIIPEILNAITEAIPEIINTVAEMIPEIITAIAEAIPQIVETVTTAIPQIIQAVLASLPTILQAITDAVPQIITALTEALPQILNAIVTMLPQIAATISELLPQIIQTIAEMIPTIVKAIVDALPQIINAIIQALPLIIDAIVEITIAIVEAIIDNLPLIIDAIIECLPLIAKAILKVIPLLLKAIVEIGGKVLSSIAELTGKVAAKLVEFAKSLPGKIKEALGSLKKVGKDFIDGLWKGIKEKWDWLVEKAKGLVPDLPEGVKKVLDIRSPSKVAEKEIGWMFTEGLIKGLEEKTSDLIKTAKLQVAEMISTYDYSIPTPSNPLSQIIPYTGQAVNVQTPQTQSQQIVNQEINFYEPVQTPAQTARMLKNQYEYGMVGI